MLFRSRMKKWVVLMILVAAVLSIAVACSQKNGNDNIENTNKPTGSVYPLTITDALDREVTLEKRPERIVSLLPSLTEILFALDAGDKVVGVTNFCDFPQEATEKEKIGDLFNLNIEVILSLDPDLVLVGRSETLQQSLAFLEENGIPYIVVDPQSLDEIEASILQVAEVIDNKAKGEAVVDEIKAGRAAIATKVAAIPEAERMNVFVLIDTETLWTVADGEFLSEMITAAGGKNAAAGIGQGYVQLSEEAFFALDPDIILSTFNMADTVLAKAAWQDLSAIKAGKVFNVNANLVSRPGPRIVLGLEELYEAINK